MTLPLASQKFYTAHEAQTIRTMLSSEGTRELGINILLTSKKRFSEDDRRALHRELNLLKSSLGSQWTWGYQNTRYQTYTYTVNLVGGYSTSNSPTYAEEDKELLEEIRKVEWRHSKRSYTTEEWQKNNRKKEYRRSAKNHYS